METKKTPKANLENKRKIFFELGLIFSILICLYGFESTTKVNQVEPLGSLNNNGYFEELPPVTRPEDAKQLVPPPPKVVDLILIVENNAKIDEELVIIDSGADANTAIDAVMQSSGKHEIDIDDTSIFISPQEMPEFPGGYKSLLNFLSQNIKYPPIASDNGVSGKVTVNFVVNKDGSISDAKILRGVDEALDKEALRVVYSMPKWKSGKQAGKNVRVSYSLPINFVLSN